MLRASSVPPGQAEPRLQCCSKPREWQLTSQEAQGGHDGADPADLLGRSPHLLSESHEENPKGLEHPHDEHIDLNGEGVEVSATGDREGGKAFPSASFVLVWEEQTGTPEPVLRNTSRVGWSWPCCSLIPADPRKTLSKLTVPKQRNKVTLELNSCRIFLPFNLLFSTEAIV